MAGTFTPPSGSTLSSRSAPIVYVASSPVVAISVGFGSRQSEERAYRDGAFVYPYLQSTRSGNTFTLRRTGGWPRHPRPYADPASAAGAPALQPTLYSPLFQVALDSRSPNTGGAANPFERYLWDRSGNGREPPSSNIYPVTGPVPGSAAQWCDAGAYSTGSDANKPLGAAANTTGPFTLTCMIQLRGYGGIPGLLSTGANRLILSCAGTAGGGAAHNALYQFFWSNHSPARLGYYRERDANVGTTALSNITEPFGAQWHFYSFRRAVDGSVTLGLDQTYETLAITPPTGGASASFLLGRQRFGIGDEPLKGALFDVCMWGRALTDAELVPLYQAAMGVT